MAFALIDWLTRAARRAKDPAPAGDDYRVLAENTTDLILRVGPGNVLRYVSPSSLQLLGWTAQEMIDEQIVAVLPEDLPIVGKAEARLQNGEVESDKATFRVRCKDGRVLWVESNARKIGGASGQPGDVVLTLRDITERKVLEDKLEALALTDGLTGLANRRAFDQALDREWRRTQREDTHLSMLLLDLDHFKGFNDSYGHQVGDDCLRAVASAVLGAVRRPGDLVARYGGEEIAVILPATDAAGAFEVAEMVRKAIEALRLPHEANPEGDRWVTASIGVSTAFSRLGGTVKMPEGLLLSADNALYKAKNGGRNRVSSSMLLVARSSAAEPGVELPTSGGV